MGVGNTEMSARLNPLESPSAVHPELPCDTNQKHWMCNVHPCNQKQDGTETGH